MKLTTWSLKAIEDCILQPYNKQNMQAVDPPHCITDQLIDQTNLKFRQPQRIRINHCSFLTRLS